MTPAELLASLRLERLSHSLTQFLWQGIAIAAAAAAVELALARRRPETRYAVSCVALLAMLVSVAVTFARWTPPASSAGTGSETAVEAVPRDGAPAVALPSRATPALSLVSARDFAARLRPLEPWIVPAWIAGVLALSARLIYGFGRARGMTDRAALPRSTDLEAALARLVRRLGVRRPVRLLESASVAVPATLGALRPVILLPVGLLVGLTPRQLEAILAHELAHVRRRDYLVNLLQSVAETLLFYHPAVWWVSRRIRVERENCCDDLAIRATGSARDYARALLGLEQFRAETPRLALAASGGNLWRRVARLFPGTVGQDAKTPARAAGVAALAALCALGAMARISPEQTPALASPPVSSGPPAPPAPPARPPRPASPAPEAPLAPAAPLAPLAPLAPESPMSPAAPAPSSRLLTPEQLIAFRQHGVTPDFVRAVAAEGFDPISPDDLVAMRIHGVTPEFLHQMTALFGRQPLDTYVAFRIHGVTPELVTAFRSAGYAKISADEAVAIRIHGVQPSDAAPWATLGYGRPSLEDLVALRVQGVDADFARRMREAGFTSLGVEDLIAMKIHGVTPEDARAFRALGFTLSAEEATSFRIHGVDTDLVGQLRALGYTDIDPDDLVALRVHGVTAEDVRRRNAKAGERLPLDEVIENRAEERP